MAGAQHYAGPNKGWSDQAPNDYPAATMTRDEALDLLNNGRVPTIYADTGECPECHRRREGGQYPHNLDCPWVVALRVVGP